MSKFYNNTTMLTFAHTGQVYEHIKDAILFTDRLVLLLAHEAYGETNIICLSLTGNVLWKIAYPIRVHSEHETYFVGMTLQEGLLLVYSKDGVEYEVSLETGNFNKYELVK